MSEVKEAMNILRKHMQDKSEGELYHAWMCNIKFAVFNTFTFKVEEGSALSDKEVLDICEEGAKVFLDRLLEKEE